MAENFSRWYHSSMIFFAFGIGFELLTISTMSLSYQGTAIGFFLLGYFFMRKSRKILQEQIKRAEKVM